MAEISFNLLLFLDFLRNKDKRTLDRLDFFTEYDEEEFQERYRLSKDVVKQLLLEVTGHTVVHGH